VDAPRAGGRVIVVGSVNMDLVVTVDHLPGPGETVTGGRFERHHGGKGANQAVAAVRLGGSVAFIGAIGADGFGVEVRDALVAEGVDLGGVVVLEEAATGVAMILVDRAGENSIAVASGANHGLTPDQVRAALERLAPGTDDVLLVGHEIRTEAARAALRLGRAAGASTILNPAPADGLDAATVVLADILTPNEGELVVLDEIAPMSPGTGVAPVLLVSMGARGARLVTSEGTAEIAALPVRAVDTVGAGDTLNGALAAAIAAGMPLVDAARWAVAAASLAVTRAGARAGMPTVAELTAALESRARG
jgi:ribokinase